MWEGIESEAEKGGLVLGGRVGKGGGRESRRRRKGYCAAPDSGGAEGVLFARIWKKRGKKAREGEENRARKGAEPGEELSS